MNNNNNTQTIVGACESFGDNNCECGFCCIDG